MQLQLNGERYETNQTNIESLLVELNLDIDRVIVLYNDEPVQQQDWNTKVLNDNDQLELLEFVGGG